MPDFPSFTNVFHHDTYPSISPDRPDLSAEGKVVFITGAGSGIGQAAAVAFAQAKAKAVAICGRRKNYLEDTKAKVLACNNTTEVIIFILDITSEEDVDKAFRSLHSQAGPVDIVINCAGHLSEAGSIRDTSVSNFWDSLETNTKGAFLISRAFLRHYVKEDGEQKVLILCSSLLGHFPASQVTTAPASYGISKIANAKLAEYVASENPGTVRAHAIQPGIVETEMSDRSVAMAPPGTRESLTWDTAELSAHFMLWLASTRGAVIPSGRFLWINWDVDELEKRGKELEDNPYMLSMVMGGWPFS